MWCPRGPRLKSCCLKSIVRETPRKCHRPFATTTGTTAARAVVEMAANEMEMETLPTAGTTRERTSTPITSGIATAKVGQLVITETSPKTKTETKEVATLREANLTKGVTQII